MSLVSRENPRISELMHKLDMYAMVGIAAVHGKDKNDAKLKEAMAMMSELRRLISNLENPHHHPYDPFPSHPGWPKKRGNYEVDPNDRRTTLDSKTVKDYYDK